MSRSEHTNNPDPDRYHHRVVIFDLDGTLTRPILDFDAIREEIGITSGPILEAIEHMNDAKRALASEILTTHEWEAARKVTLYDGAVDVVAQCRSAEYWTALLTRNTRPIVDFLIKKYGFEFDAIRTREDGAIKPSPEPVLSICEQLKAEPSESWMVGDFLFDIMSGRAAGTHTVLMIGNNPDPTDHPDDPDPDPDPEFAALADHVIRKLRDLLPLLDAANHNAK